MRITYPVPLASASYPATVGAAEAAAKRKSRTVILSGDAQTDAWSHVLADFPHLVKDGAQLGAPDRGPNRSSAAGVRRLQGPSPRLETRLNLELVERLGDRSGSGPSHGPPWIIVSSATDADSGYGFPHAVMQELIREVRDPQAQAGGRHPPDDELGIHYTSGLIGSSSGVAAGSVACVIAADAKISLYRLGDTAADSINLANAGDDPLRVLAAWSTAHGGMDPGSHLQEADVPIKFWNRIGD